MGTMARESVDSGGWRENKQRVHTENNARGARDGAHCWTTRLAMSRKPGYIRSIGKTKIVGKVIKDNC